MMVKEKEVIAEKDLVIGREILNEANLGKHLWLIILDIFHLRPVTSYFPVFLYSWTPYQEFFELFFVHCPEFIALNSFPY